MEIKINYFEDSENFSLKLDYPGLSFIGSYYEHIKNLTIVEIKEKEVTCIINYRADSLDSAYHCFVSFVNGD